ncbi:MAG: enolase C-terminal domain-like protein [Acidimicrobiales bacterium]
MRVSVTLWREDVDMARPVLGAAQRHEHRVRLLVRIDADGAYGYGEVSPQPRALNGDPGLDEVVDELVALVIPQTLDIAAREGELPRWSRLHLMAGSRRASAPAVALIEMALLDRDVRRGAIDLADLWPFRHATPDQATVSALDEATEWRVDPSVARVRVKCGPLPLEPWVRERVAALERPILLDYNARADSDETVLAHVADLGRVATVDVVEQPYAPGNLVDPARLATRLDVALGMDEGVRSVRDLEHVVHYAAAQVVCVKPARVGGVAHARTMILWAREHGLRAYLGGFFESPLARTAHRRLAESCVSEPSDLGRVALRVAVDGEDDAPPGPDADVGVGAAPTSARLAHARVLASWP